MPLVGNPNWNTWRDVWKETTPQQIRDYIVRRCFAELATGATQFPDDVLWAFEALLYWQPEEVFHRKAFCHSPSSRGIALGLAWKNIPHKVEHSASPSRKRNSNQVNAAFIPCQFGD